MDTVTRIIAKFWSFVISIFGNAAEKSNNPESADFTRAIIIGIRIAGRLCRCEIVPHLPEKGRFHCAILWRNGSQSLKPRTLQQIAEFIARDYFRRSPDSVGWIYIPQRSGAKPVIGLSYFPASCWTKCAASRGISSRRSSRRGKVSDTTSSR